MPHTNSSEHVSDARLRFFVITISDKIDKAVMWICAIFLVLMTIDLLLGVFCRYVIKNPFVWTEELSRYMMIWVAGLAMSSCIKRGEHLAIRFLVDSLPSKIAFVIDMLLRFILFGFLLVLTWYGIDLVITNIEFTSQALDISMAYPVSAVPVSGSLMIIQLIIVTYLRLTIKK